MIRCDFDTSFDLECCARFKHIISHQILTNVSLHGNILIYFSCYLNKNYKIMDKKKMLIQTNITKINTFKTK